jgi:hypothetical protein
MMPKQRPPNASQTQHCSFCGEHKNSVPLIITSNIKPQSACCSTCALAIVQQTQVWAYGVFQEAMKIQKKAPHLVVTNKQIVSDAIKKASDNGKGR